ncbi:putative pyruvate dehydrogenase E1 component subunit alpha, mitochondrial [Trichinella nativa]|uniref:Pyruvate dehydrogenase E1 component subunit alpha n=1 Tax=Trichinella nativa TaxID=6335 RepID=A0A0V1LT69_9BILA|nr:putative pyruvate dehydrogenase E1 component subunit alpha, mitochondrial [Trichinella nativa]
MQCFPNCMLSAYPLLVDGALEMYFLIIFSLADSTFTTLFFHSRILPGRSVLVFILCWTCGMPTSAENLLGVSPRFHPVRMHASPYNDVQNPGGRKQNILTAMVMITCEEGDPDISKSIADQLDTLIRRGKIIKNEMAVFEAVGQRRKALQKLYDVLITVPPTFCGAEQSFSSAFGLFVTKLRSSLKDETIDMLWAMSVFNLIRCFHSAALIFRSSSGMNFSTAAEAAFDITVNIEMKRGNSIFELLNLLFKPFKTHKLDSAPAQQVTVTRDEAMKYLREMLLVRRMETTASNMYKEKQIRGFCHLYSGQEAVAVGMKAAMNEGDSIITAYRCHGWSLLSGITLKQVFAELAGRVTGAVHGKGGSMHMYNAKSHFYGGCAIVGAQIPLGTGISFAYKYRDEKKVSFCLYGDGASNQGQLYESLNMAKLWRLPCVFVCENNGYGMGTSVERSSASTEYYTRGDYVPGLWVNAMDVLAVRQATKWVAEYCREGNGPVVLEMATYRYFGHSMSDPGTSYRTREEIQKVRKLRDPITGFREKMLSANLATEEELKDLEKQVRKEVEKALEEALKDVDPPLELLYTDVYKDTPNLVLRGTSADVVTVLPKTLTSDVLKI